MTAATTAALWAHTSALRGNKTGQLLCASGKTQFRTSDVSLDDAGVTCAIDYATEMAICLHTIGRSFHTSVRSSPPPQIKHRLVTSCGRVLAAIEMLSAPRVVRDSLAALVSAVCLGAGLPLGPGAALGRSPPA